LENRKKKNQQIKQGMMKELLTGKTHLHHSLKGLADGHDLTVRYKMNQSGNQGNPANKGLGHLTTIG